jgi:hypothetical protein
MATLTDPATELADIADRLMQNAQVRGDQFLAQQFSVDPWSTELMRIIACIMERADLVNSIVQRSTMDDSHKRSAHDDLNRFKGGFTGEALRQNWNNSSNNSGMTIMKDWGRPLKYLAQTVRAEVRYPKLSDNEIDELISLINSYLAELSQSDEGPDFVRRAIEDGLNALKFQLHYIGWMGSGHVLAALREVMLVYEASRWELEQTTTLDSEAALKGLLGIIKFAKGKIDTAKGWSDTAQTVWKAYQVGSAVATPLLLTFGMHAPK